MSSFTTELKVRPLPDGRHWELLEEFDYYLGSLDSGMYIRVPKGFVTDFASVPRIFWWLFPPWGKYGKAAVVHDYLYHTRMFSRVVSDAIFLEAMVVLKVPLWKRLIIYWAVRIGGWVPWVFGKRKDESNRS